MYCIIITHLIKLEFKQVRTTAILINFSFVVRLSQQVMLSLTCQMSNMFLYRMLFPTFILVLLLSSQLLFSVEARTKKSKSVTTLLDAKWEVTPLVLEVAEYLADENISFFWSYIDSITALKKAPVEIGK